MHGETLKSIEIYI